MTKLATEPARCGVCGLLHPFLIVCPYVQEQEVREEFTSDGRRRRVSARIVRTRYFPRPEIAAESLPSLEDSPGTEVEAEAEGAQP